MQVMTEEREKELVARAKGGDKMACGSLLWQYRWLVTKVVRSVMGERATDVNVEDAVQETFLYAFAHLNEYKPGRFYSWLWEIAKQKAKEATEKEARYQKKILSDSVTSAGWYSADGWDWSPADLAAMVRRLQVAKRRIDRHNRPDDFPLLGDNLIKEEEARNVMSCLAGILSPMELADLEKVADGKTTREIAEMTGRTRNAVKLSIWRSKQKARLALVTR